MFVDTNYPTSLSEIGVEGSTWILVLGFVIAFFLAFGVGANDVANSFGTSVGSKVLTLRQACILATIFEVVGAVTMGYNVSATIRGGMIYIEQYSAEPKLLMLGFLAALIGSTVWNLIATMLGMPISGTHSIVGAIIGFSIVAKGWASVKWNGLIKIVASWFLSPLLSGIVSLVLFLGIRYYIVNRDDSLKRGLIALPIFYSATIFVNIFSIVHEGPHVLSKVNWWMALLIAGAIAITVALVVWFVVVPRLRAKILTLLNVIGNKKAFPLGEKSVDSTSIEMSLRSPATPVTPIDEKSQPMSPALPVANGEANGHVNPAYVNGNGTATGPTENGNSKNGSANGNGTATTNGNGVPVIRVERAKSISLDAEMSMTTTVDHTIEKASEDDDKPEVAQLFTFLQILTACFGSFAHGGNDVSNAIGPLVAVMLIFRDGNPSGETPWYILLYGGIGISIGLWAWGRIVIKTMGSDLTKITPTTGFTIEIGAAMTVLIASKIGLPISTTHCKVGSVVMVGKAQKAKQGVNWKLFGNIAATWILTVPLTALMSAFSMWLLRMAI